MAPRPDQPIARFCIGFALAALAAIMLAFLSLCVSFCMYSLNSFSADSLLRVNLAKNIDFLTLPGQLGQERVGVGAHNPLADLVEDEDEEAHGDGDEPVLGGDGSAAKEVLAGVDYDRGERD